MNDGKAKINRDVKNVVNNAVDKIKRDLFLLTAEFKYMAGKVAAYNNILKAQAVLTGKLNLLLKHPQAVPQPKKKKKPTNILEKGTKFYTSAVGASVSMVQQFIQSCSSVRNVSFR